MTVVVVLTLDEMTETSVRYREKTKDRPQIIGTLELARWVLPETVPPEMRVTLEFPRAEPAIFENTGASIPARDVASKATLSVGAKVTIVKNTRTGTKYPPEWLAQYLGRTGVVLWTTNDGAMVQLAEGATWFPYAELSAVD